MCFDYRWGLSIVYPDGGEFSSMVDPKLNSQSMFIVRLFKRNLQHYRGTSSVLD